MSDTSLDNLATGSSLYGSPLDLSSGASSGGSSSLLSGISGAGAGSLAAGAVGAGALGYLISQGPGSLPPQYQQLEGNVPGMEAEASALEGQGGALVGQGTQALGMAQRGELTPEQQAQLKIYSSGLTNTARQTYANMGRNPDQDTSFIQTQGNIDTQVNAMAQQQIQSTIQLGLGEVSGGNSLISSGLGFENAANQALIAAGQAQIQLDQQYSANLTAAFSAIGNIAGAVMKVSDLNAKRNVTQIGTLFDGTPVYRYQYVGGTDWDIGVMAQDVEKFAPDAVHEIGGIKHVDVVKATDRAVRA